MLDLLLSDCVQARAEAYTTFTLDFVKLRGFGWVAISFMPQAARYSGLDEYSNNT